MDSLRVRKGHCMRCMRCMQIYHGSTSALAPLCTLEGAVWINNFDKRYKPLPFKLGRWVSTWLHGLHELQP